MQRGVSVHTLSAELCSTESSYNITDTGVEQVEDKFHVLWVVIRLIHSMICFVGILVYFGVGLDQSEMWRPTGSFTCTFAQIIFLPLFKPIMWSFGPAIMPIVEMLYWEWLMEWHQLFVVCGNFR